MTGVVYLVGAGPGDPGLITVRGIEALRQAEVVVYDRLVAEELLREAPTDAELIYVGKAAGRHALSQEAINELLWQRARAGRRVVRLKGGDPFVFGRGGEEAAFLAARGVPFVVVPGVTSAVAALAYAGIPITHRRHASSFLVATGHEDPAKEESALRWEHLAHAADTLVFLMGVERLERIVQRLLSCGRSPSTPAALVQWGTTPRQRTVVAPLAAIAQRAEGVEPPALLVVGNVVELRPHLQWFDNLPLFGLRVLVTRSREQAGRLSRLLRDRGADPVELPTIATAPVEDPSSLDAALRDLGSFDWVVFTSANGVEACWRRLVAMGMDARAFAGARLCALGPATAEALDRRGLRADWVPDEYVAEAVLAGLSERVRPGQRVLLPRADLARDVLVDGLRQLGVEVVSVVAYRTVRAEGSKDAARRLLQEGVDVVTLTSSSTARNLVELLDGDVALLRRSTVACIGPVTAATAQALGLRVDVVARTHTIPGLVEALEEAVRCRRVERRLAPEVEGATGGSE
ncbi:MAG TPA: uroporphyrinogen-III C-methyltransferase [Chloroflexota bacterium]